jgi:outer membrane immunogenic protein
MKKILIGALLAGVATSAFAADLPTRKGPPPAPYAPPPIFTWTGFYLGVNGGGGWASLRHNDGVFRGPSGGLGGVTAGYNYQIGQFVAGLEGDFDWGDISSRRTLDPAGSFGKINMSEFATARARLGVAFDRALLYVTGGYAGAEVHSRLLDATTATFTSDDSWRNGYVVGAGLEYAFTQNVSAKAEYLFSQVGGTTLATPTYAGRTGLDISLVRAGINYRF